ncbi:MAG TPA: small ribosomal subunit Rsm22 family protein [Holophagaceae bacterium]|nr:small ribosomal subunit Rsm22 family protein [Holophagaceae bacterium]
MIAPGPVLLDPLRARWEAMLPALAGALPAGWGVELRKLSDRFNRIEGAPEGDYFSAANIEPHFAHHGWAQAAALAAVMAETPSAFEGVRRVWDLGGGPGVLTAAASALMPDAIFDLSDLRPEALSWAETRLRPMGVQLNTKRQRLPVLPDGTPDLVILGHVLNELHEWDQVDLLAAIKARLSPRGRILILEPALQNTTRRLMELRDQLREAPYAILAPCPCADRCPMLALERQWCVAERPWNPPPWFLALDAAAGLDRRQLSFAYLLVQKNGIARAPIARVVGVPRPQKGKVERWMCRPEGGERWEALARHGEPDWALPRCSEVDLRNDGEVKEQPGAWPVRRFRS